MTTIRPIALMTLAASLLAGCHADDAGKPESQDTEHLIQLSAVTATPVVLTRIGAADTYNSLLPEESDVAVYIYDDAGTYLKGKVGQTENVTATWVYRTGAPYAAGEGLYKSGLSLHSHARTPVFPKLNESTLRDYVDIFAVFPNDTNYVPTDSSYTVTVPSDQTGSTTDNAAAIADADLLTTNGMVRYTKAQCDANALVELPLKHRMAKMTVVFTPKAGSDLTAANMPTKFDVIGVYTSLTVMPSAGTVTTVESGAATLKGSTTQSILLPPQTLTAGATLLKFNIKGSSNFKGIEAATFKVPSGGITLQEGHEYLVNVTVDVDHITMTGTITSWTDGGTLDYTAYEDSIR